VLLTGHAAVRVAVNAFNRGLIEQFIAKQMPDMSRHLVNVMHRLLATPHARHAQTWRATLEPEHSALLRDLTVAAELSELASRRWVEHVVIGDPFGVLGMDAAGNASWLQLESRAGLPALAEVAVQAGLDDAAVQDIRTGRRLANVELGSSLQCPVELADAFTLGSQHQLLAAHFPLAREPGDTGYARWLERQPRRQVEP
jgi:hypothetical protein